MTFLFYGLGAYLARYLHPDLLNTIRRRDKRKPSTSLYRSHEIGLQVKLTVSYSRGEFTMINRITQSLLRRLAYSVPGGYRLRPFLHRLRGVKIGKNVWISQYVYIDEIHPEAISIGDNTTIGIGTSIIAHFYWGPRKKDFKSKVVIGNNVFIGPHCVILPEVEIGDGAVIQAGTTVSRSVPPATLWGTSKARPLGRVTVPLTHHTSASDFVKGLRPL